VRNVNREMRTGVAAQKNTHKASRYLRAARLPTSALRSTVMRCENKVSHALSFIARMPYNASLITYNIHVYNVYMYTINVVTLLCHQLCLTHNMPKLYCTFKNLVTHKSKIALFSKNILRKLVTAKKTTKSLHLL